MNSNANSIVNIKTILLFIISIYCVINIEAYAQNPGINRWFVDKNATGQNDGTSWENAWTSFANINWNLIQPGSTVYISGGTDSTVYNEDLIMSKDGTANGLITFTKGLLTGHNGKVVINGCIHNDGKDYLKYSKLTINGCITNFYNNVCYMDSLYVENPIGTGIVCGGSGAWYERYDVDSIFISNSTILNPANYSSQADCIYAGNTQNLFIYNNTIVNRNTIAERHDDNIQLLTTKDVYIYQNRLMYNDGITVGQVFIQENIFSGGTYIYNNLIYAPDVTTAQAVLAKKNPTGSTAQFHLYGNTIIQGTIHVINIQDPEGYVKNNIIIKNGEGRMIEAVTQTDPSRWNNNLYYQTGGGSAFVLSSGEKTFAQWQALGYDVNSVYDDPDLVNLRSDWNLQSTSPAINAGATLGSPYNVDILGVTRPVDSAYDIGAYEYTSGSIVDITPPQLLSARVLDSVTVILEFSELMNESSVENPNNYEISNGIDVFNVLMTGNQVKLSTSVHTDGVYQLVVNNVKDIAGNVISLNNTAEYSYEDLSSLIQIPAVRVSASVVPEANHTPEKTLDGKGAADGDPDSRWAGDTMPEWLVYDFGKEYELSLTKLSFYRWDQGRIYNYSLQSSNDSIIWKNIRTNLQSTAQQWTTQNVGNVQTRYLKVIFNSNNQSTWAGLWEAQFWGTSLTQSDNTPPILEGVVALNSTSVNLLFSEELDNASAININNYSINNGISINGALLSGDNKQVTLTTSQYTSNTTYIVTVSSVKDLSGNAITNNNTASYTFIDNTIGNLKANVKIFLEGPYYNGTMLTEISANELLPNKQPYNAGPWFYNGSESLGLNTSTVTDWVLVELRNAQNPAQVIARRAGLLRNDGRILETNGTLGVTFNNLLYGSYYIAVIHRNHLAVMSSVPVQFSPDNTLYDFTTSVSQAYGSNGEILLANGVYGMISGDANSDGTDDDKDRNVWNSQNGTIGYLNGDFNLDSGVTVKDINDYWNLNEGKVTQVP